MTELISSNPQNTLTGCKTFLPSPSCLAPRFLTGLRWSRSACLCWWVTGTLAGTRAMVPQNPWEGEGQALSVGKATPAPDRSPETRALRHGTHRLLGGFETLSLFPSASCVLPSRARGAGHTVRQGGTPPPALRRVVPGWTHAGSALGVFAGSLQCAGAAGPAVCQVCGFTSTRKGQGSAGVLLIRFS